MDEMLRVKLGALTECAREMQSALEEYEAAVNEAQSAAQALGDEWKGAARDAFVAEQARAYRAHGMLENAIHQMLRGVKDAIVSYRETENKVRNAIQE